MNMHSTSEMGVNNVPAFLMKIWTLVEDPSTDELIAWDPSGMSFHVYDQARFAKEILPFCFKHNNIASFIRQLNMYGFRKVVHIDTGAIKQEVDDVEFQHPYFVRGQESLLENIKRKASGTGGGVAVKAEPGVKLNTEQVSSVLHDVNQIKGKQENLTSKMDKMKKENEALWREIASLRQKHMKQQQIVNKLIQFMVHLVGGKRGLSTTNLPKRKMPLMISDSSQLSSPKRPRYAKQLSIEELDTTPYVVTTSPASIEGSPGGPIIHEVTDTLSPSNLTDTLSSTNLPFPEVSPAAASPSSPHLTTLPRNGGVTTSLPPDIPVASSSSASSAVEPVKRQPELSLDCSLDSTDLNNLLAVTMGNMMPTNPDSLIVNSLSNQLEGMQDDLDSIKDLLSGGQYNFDANTMSELFSSQQDDSGSGVIANLLGDIDTREPSPSTSLTLPNTDTHTSDPHNSIIGNELVQFQPGESIFPGVPDLADYISDEETSGNIVDPMSFINTEQLDTPHPQPQD